MTGPNFGGTSLVITILLAGLVEAVINLYCAFKFSATQLAAIDKLSLLEKWTTAPSFASKDYRFDKSGSHYANLQSLIRARNAIVHMQPEFKRGDALLHRGNAERLQTISHKSIMAWLSLPHELVMHLKSHDQVDGSSLHVISEIGDFSQDGEAKLNVFRKRLGQNSNGST